MPDLILLDLGLPDISGAEVLERLRADTTTMTIPVVVVSADATDSQTARLLAAGAAAYLTKPLDVRHFFATVEETLQIDRAARLPEQTRTALEQAITAATALSNGLS